MNKQASQRLATYNWHGIILTVNLGCLCTILETEHLSKAVTAFCISSEDQIDLAVLKTIDNYVSTNGL